MPRKPSRETMEIALAAAGGNPGPAAAALGMTRDELAAALKRPELGEQRGRPRRTLDEEAIRKAYAETGSVRATARAVGEPFTTVQRHLAAAGLTGKGKGSEGRKPRK